MSNVGAALGAAVPDQQCPCRGQPAERREVARAEDRSRQGAVGANALRHGMRALQYVVLPDEDAVEFQALEAALDELAPVGALQPCWRAGSRSPPGVWRAPIAWRSSCSRSGAGRTPASAWP